MDNLERILKEGEAKFPEELVSRSGVSSEHCTTFSVGASVSRLVEPHSLSAAIWLVKEFHEGGVSARILGAGSNLVLPDEIFAEPVIRLGRGISGALSLPASVQSFDELDVLSKTPAPVFGETESVLAFAGASLMSLSRRVSQAGLSGLEFAAGIPASLGGAVRMNAGAHGHSISEVVRKIFFLSQDGTPGELSGDNLKFTYRRCELPPAAIVIAAELLLQPGDPEAVSSLRQDCLDYRRRTQPLQFPSAGSVFRNPGGTDTLIPAAGALLEQAGMKGRRRGSIVYSELHANWLIRDGDSGRAADVRQLVEDGKTSVGEKFGVSLETEIIFW